MVTTRSRHDLLTRTTKVWRGTVAGNRAAIVALSSIQREEPTPAPSSGVDTDGPGRLPQSGDDTAAWGGAFRAPDTATYRIIVEPTYGYNCFAWAVGVTTRDITSDTIWGVGKYEPNLDGWTKYLVEHHGFGRSTEGLNPRDPARTSRYWRHVWPCPALLLARASGSGRAGGIPDYDH